VEFQGGLLLHSYNGVVKVYSTYGMTVLGYVVRKEVPLCDCSEIWFFKSNLRPRLLMAYECTIRLDVYYESKNKNNNYYKLYTI